MLNNINLKIKWILVVFAINILFLFIFFGLIYLPEQNIILTNSLLDRLKRTSEFYSPLVIEAFVKHNDPKMISLLQNIKKDPEILYVRIIDNNGNITSSNLVEEWGKADKDMNIDKIIASNNPIINPASDQSGYDYSVPIISIDKKIASFSIGISTEKIGCEYKQIKNKAMFWIVVFSLILLIIHLILLQLLILSPIKQLNSAIESVLLGKTGEELAIKRNDEFGKLSKNINKLIRKLTGI